MLDVLQSSLTFGILPISWLCIFPHAALAGQVLLSGFRQLRMIQAQTEQCVPAQDSARPLPANAGNDDDNL